MFLITNFSFPVVVFVFLMKDIPYGSGGTALYGLGLLFCFLVLITLLSGGGAIGEGFLFMGFSIACMGSALAVPLTVSKATGFLLTTPKRFANQLAKMEFDETFPLDGDEQ